jgi:DNA polymerase epsilon subunit 2
MTRNALERVVKHFIKKGNRDQQLSSHYIQVIDVFTIPKYLYKPEKKQFEMVKESEKPTILGPADSKINMFRERCDIIKQRMMRTDLFQAEEDEGLKVRSASLSCLSRIFR